MSILAGDFYLLTAYELEEVFEEYRIPPADREYFRRVRRWRRSQVNLTRARARPRPRYFRIFMALF